MGIKIVQGSILEADVDCIVNPANSHLRHSGGLARVIADAADPFTPEGLLPQADFDVVGAWRVQHRNAPLVPTGGAYVTSAGALPYKGVVHAVGPVWGGGCYEEHTLLRLAHQNAFYAAWSRGWKSIAYPAISCGIFGFPVREAAHIAIQFAHTTSQFHERYSGGTRIEFYLPEEEHYNAYYEALNNLKGK